MSELPKCRLCGVAPMNYPMPDGTQKHHCADRECTLHNVLMTHDQWTALMGGGEAVAVVRYTSDGALAECPCCGSLDVGGAHDTVHCYRCGLSITKRPPLKNAIDAWNMRQLYTHPAPAVDGAVLRDAVADAIGRDTYDCSRVWSAWGYGTMSEDDFTPIINDINRLQEIVDAVKAAMKGEG